MPKKHTLVARFDERLGIPVAYPPPTLKTVADLALVLDKYFPGERSLNEPTLETACRVLKAAAERLRHTGDDAPNNDRGGGSSSAES